MNVNDLPEEILREIFQLFPLAELIQHRIICSTWNDAILGIGRTKQSLLLTLRLKRQPPFASIPGLSESDLALLHPPTFPPTHVTLSVKQKYLTASFARFLATLLPQLSSLIVCIHFHRATPTYTQLSFLLTHLTTLQSLALFGQHKSPSTEPQVRARQFYQQLGASQSLTSLNLKLGHQLTDAHLAHIGTRLIGQLEHFAIHQCNISNSTLFPIIGPNCSSLSVEPPEESSTAIWTTTADLRYFQFPQALASLKLNLDNESVLSSICQQSQFNNLVTLNLTFRLIIIDLTHLRQLQRLPKLTGLTLNNINLHLNLADPNIALATLSLIKKLTLTSFGFVYGLGRGDILCQTLAIIFPNTETLKLRSSMNYYFGEIQDTELACFKKLKKYQIFLGNVYRENI